MGWGGTRAPVLPSSPCPSERARSGAELVPAGCPGGTASCHIIPTTQDPGAVDFSLLPSVEPGDPRGTAARPDQDWPVFAGGRAWPRDRLNPQELAVLSRELYQQTLPCWTPGWGAGLPRTLENLRAPRSKKGPSALSGAWPGGPLPHRGQGHTCRTQNQRRWPGPLTT